MTNQPEITRASNERRKWRDRIIAFSLSIQTCRSQFSDGEDSWTKQDDCLAYQIDCLQNAIDDAADQLTRAAMTHRLALDAFETRLEADRLAED